MNGYLINKNTIKNSNKFKNYIYLKYSILCIITILILILIHILLINKNYKEGINLYNKENYKEAYNLLKKYPKFRKSNNYLRKITIKNLNNFKVGEILYFGENITWKILDIKDDNYLISTNGTIDLEDAYNDWKSSNIRYLLNNEFYYKNFNKNEKNIILTMILEDEETFDKIFLLKEDEAENYNIKEYEITYRDENHYSTKELIFSPVMWISTINKPEEYINNFNIYLDMELLNLEEKDIYKTKIGMYDYLLKKDNGKICYYWKGIKDDYYACSEEKDGKRIITEENINYYGKNDILNKRNEQNEE